MYQSHIYKISVNPNSLSLNPYLLLAILGSPVVQRQIKAKQFTMDIIDSLGERINEIILPISKSRKRCEEVTEMVRASVQRRIEARDLSRQARLGVVSVDTRSQTIPSSS